MDDRGLFRIEAQPRRTNDLDLQVAEALRTVHSPPSSVQHLHLPSHRHRGATKTRVGFVERRVRWHGRSGRASASTSTRSASATASVS